MVKYNNMICNNKYIVKISKKGNFHNNSNSDEESYGTNQTTQFNQDNKSTSKKTTFDETTLPINNPIFNNYSNNTYSNNTYSNHSDFSNNTLSGNLISKKLKLKKLQNNGKKRKQINNSERILQAQMLRESHNGYNNKEYIMLRNRITAKISRDRKKKEYEQLSQISKNLMNENYMLNQELEKKEKEIQFYKNSSNSLCNDCKIILLNKNLQEPSIFSIDDITDEGRSNFSNYLKYSVYASFLVVMCIIGAFSTFNIINPEVVSNVTKINNPVESINGNVHNQRMLLSLPQKGDDLYDMANARNHTDTGSGSGINKTSTDLVLMEKLIQIYKPKEYIQMYKGGNDDNNEGNIREKQNLPKPISSMSMSKYKNNVDVNEFLG